MITTSKNKPARAELAEARETAACRAMDRALENLHYSLAIFARRNRTKGITCWTYDHPTVQAAREAVVSEMLRYGAMALYIQRVTGSLDRERLRVIDKPPPSPIDVARAMMAPETVEQLRDRILERMGLTTAIFGRTDSDRPISRGVKLDHRYTRQRGAVWSAMKDESRFSWGEIARVTGGVTDDAPRVGAWTFRSM
jgi:hypothetical protein